MSMSAESVIGQDSHGEDELVVVAPLPLVEKKPQEVNETSDTGNLNGVVLNGIGGALSVSECVQLSQEEIGALKTEELRDLVTRMQILMVADTDNKTQLILDLRPTVEEMTNYLKEEKLTTKSAPNDMIPSKELSIRVNDHVFKRQDHVIKMQNQLIEFQEQLIVQVRKNSADIIRVKDGVILEKNDLIGIQNSEIKDLQQKLKLYETQKLQQQVSSSCQLYSPKIVGTRKSTRLTRFAQNVSTKIKRLFL